MENKQEFKLGDKVKVVENVDGTNLAGKIATIVYVYEDSSSLWGYGLEFSEKLPNSDGHTVNGKYKDGFGRFSKKSDKLELINSIELQGGKMTKKVVYNVLAVNKKNGKVVKDETVVAEGERNAILQAFGVNVDSLVFSVTARTEFEEDKPQKVIVEKETKVN
mgnify:CR=1 FL=1